MKIVLKTKWMGRDKGTLLDLRESVARRLVAWNSARIAMPEDEKKQEKVKAEETEQGTFKTRKDRMMEESPVAV